MVTSQSIPRRIRDDSISSTADPFSRVRMGLFKTNVSPICFVTICPGAIRCVTSPILSINVMDGTATVLGWLNPWIGSMIYNRMMKKKAALTVMRLR